MPYMIAKQIAGPTLMQAMQPHYSHIAGASIEISRGNAAHNRMDIVHAQARCERSRCPTHPHVHMQLVETITQACCCDITRKVCCQIGNVLYLRCWRSSTTLYICAIDTVLSGTALKIAFPTSAMPHHSIAALWMQTSH